MLSGMPVGLRFRYPKFDSGWKTTLLTSVSPHGTMLKAFFCRGLIRMLDGFVSSHPQIRCFMCYNPTVLLVSIKSNPLFLGIWHGYSICE